MHGSIGPHLVAGEGEGIEDFVLAALHEVFGIGFGERGEHVDVTGEVAAVGVEREVVDVVAEGVLDLLADGCDAENDVRGEDRAGDGDPFEGVVELEWEEHHVHPGDLGDGNTVRDGERVVEDTLGAREGVGKHLHVGHDVGVRDAVGEGAVLQGHVDVGLQVGQDLEGEVAEVVFGFLHQFAGVGFGEGDT